MAIEIVPLTKADIPAAVECVQKAFSDDPYFRWAFNDPAKFNTERNAASLAAHFQYGLSCDCPISVAKVACSICDPKVDRDYKLPPGSVVGVGWWYSPQAARASQTWSIWAQEWLLSFRQLLNNIRFLGRGGLNLSRYWIWKQVQMDAHKTLWTDPRGYYFCNMVGVSSQARGMGVGKRLMESVMEKADREGMPCYLESSKGHPNITIYEKMGFELIKEIQCVEGGEVCKAYNVKQREGLSTIESPLLTQTFVNPSSTEPIPEVLYTFPLYDGASVVAFTCRVGDDIIRGKVKPKKEADEIYQKAKAKGQTGAIFDQSYNARDVFKTRVGNVPAGGTVVIEITVVEELKQDAQTNGPRYTVPMAIAPRYGVQQYDDGPLLSRAVEGRVTKTAIKVDVIMEKACMIRSVRSPSHPIELNLGRASYMTESTFEPYYASVKLQNNAVLDEDFVLTVKCDNQDNPVAFLETHPTLPNQQALMVSLVPKFSLSPDLSEIVFVIDRSGSMGDKIVTLRSALEVLLKSLPLGVPFNIVSFGDHCSTLWPRSRISDKASLSDALEFTQTIDADMGGTEILAALKAAVENHYKDTVPEVLLLTDGEVWNQSEVFKFVDEAVQKSSARFFSLGVGNAASHSLINGIARAGRGFSQSVLKYEELDKKVIRMLKGALTPRLEDCRLDLGLSVPMEEEEFVEINPPTSEKPSLEATTKPISFFDECQDDSGTLKFRVSLCQACSLPSNVILRANSRHGPLALGISVQDVGSGETLHQLAAKKAMTELEESRGWVQNAKTNRGESIKEKFESRINELVQKECERLGARFQIAGKHCSFVAVRETETDSEPMAENARLEVKASAMTDNEIDGEIDLDCAEHVSTMLLCDVVSFDDEDDDAATSCAPASAYATSASPGLCESYSEDEESDEEMGFALYDDDTPPSTRIMDLCKSRPIRQLAARIVRRSDEISISESDDESYEARVVESKLQRIVQLQAFEGYWDWCDELHQILDLDQKALRSKLLDRYKVLTGIETDFLDRSDWKEILATSLVGLYLETRAPESKDVWELLKEKADRWVENALQSMNFEHQGVARELITELNSSF